MSSLGDARGLGEEDAEGDVAEHDQVRVARHACQQLPQQRLEPPDVSDTMRA